MRRGEGLASREPRAVRIREKEQGGLGFKEVSVDPSAKGGLSRSVGSAQAELIDAFACAAWRAEDFAMCAFYADQQVIAGNRDTVSIFWDQEERGLRTPICGELRMEDAKGRGVWIRGGGALFLEGLECAQQVDFSESPEGVIELLCGGGVCASAADQQIADLFKVQLGGLLEQECDRACGVRCGLAGSLGDVVGGGIELGAKGGRLCA